MPQKTSCRLFSILSLAILVFAGTVANAEDPAPAEPASKSDATKYDLQYKLTTGTVLRYEIDHRAAIRSTIDETTQEAQTKTESVKSWKVTDVLPSGEIEFMNVVESVHMRNHLPDRAPSEYDSKTDKTPPPGYEDTARAIGVPLSVVRMTPRGKITSRNVKLQQPNADKDAQVVIRLPDGPVAVGATWDEPFDITVNIDDGGTKSIQTRRHYELLSVENGIAKIEVTYQVLSPIDSKVESQLVQKLMKGTARFDVGKGRIDSQLFEVDKRVLGFAGPTSSMHYVMRMEEKLSEDKLAASAPLRETSLLKKTTTLVSKDPAEKEIAASVTKETTPEPTPKIATKPEPPKSTTPKSTSPQRRQPSRSANRSSSGKPTQYR